MNRKEYAVVFRHDNDKKPDVVEVNVETDEEEMEDRVPTLRDLIRLPTDRSVEYGSLSVDGNGNKIRGLFVCDDKPSEVCAADGDKDHNGWHPRLFGDFALIVKTEAQAKWLQKHATPIIWFP